jgi:hypothetical protein
MASSTLTNLLPDLYTAVDNVSRELTGFIPAAARDSNAERAAKNEDVRVPITTSESASDISPSNTPPSGGGNTVNNRTITISNFRHVQVTFTGEEEMGLRNAGTFENIQQARFFQAMRTLVNEIEQDCADLYYKAARAVQDAGTTPFGNAEDLSDFADAARILDENGAPQMDRQLVLDTTAMANLRGNNTILQKVNEAGTNDALREGMFERVHNLSIRNSQQVVSHSSGAGTGLQTNSGSLSAGTTDIPLDTGSNDVKQGDILTASGDANKYIVNNGFTGGSGTATINQPGLEASIADNTSVDDPADYVANMFFHRDAMQLATRTPAVPEGGDDAEDRATVEDPQTGLAFDVATYPGYHQNLVDIGIAWGVDVTKEEHLGILLG